MLKALITQSVQKIKHTTNYAILVPFLLKCMYVWEGNDCKNARGNKAPLEQKKEKKKCNKLNIFMLTIDNQKKKKQSVKVARQ